jgi:uncharacterized protein YjhX (UPF0386 family)
MRKGVNAPSCVAIFDEIKRHGSCTISQLNLAVNCGYSLPSVQKAVSMLKQANKIAVKPGRPYRYEVIGDT